VDLWEFDMTQCENPQIIHIHDNIFAITYTGANDEGFLRTLEVLPTGVINRPFISNYSIDPDCFYPKIININDTRYAITYSRGEQSEGFIKTIEIFPNGTINQSSMISWQFTTSTEIFHPCITQFVGDIYAIAYVSGGGNSDGSVITIEILPDGTIIGETATILAGSLGPDKCFEPQIVKISDQIVAVIYRAGVPHKGYITTLRLSSDSIPPFLRGVYKTNSYGIFANMTTAVALINNEIITAPILPNNWTHVAMTYNRTSRQMKLYINGTLKNSQSIDPIIDPNDNEIIFGKLFSGIIDEIAIYAKELTIEEIRNHMDNPETMELSLG
jgi:hypothetical protein